MSLEGKQLDRYQIVRLIGSGGMGDVYLAEDERIGQQVAIKVIQIEASPYPDSQAGQKAADLFRREARAIAMLDHPHILPLYNYGEQQIGEMNIAYLVMPYRPEGSLANWISHRDSTGLLPPQQVTQIVLQAASALQHAHDHQIIHQDVKPSNFLMRSHEKAQQFPDILLADFGIAKLTTAASSTSQSIRGTPTYMAPEQWQGKPVPASDQYALAVMAYELLTGHPLFRGVPGTVMYQHLTAAPTLPSSLNPLLSSEIDRVLLQALEKQPEERFVSVITFAHALHHAIQLLDTRDDAVNIPTLPASSLQPTPDSTAISPTLPAANKNLAAVSSLPKLESSEKYTPASLPLAREANTPVPDSFTVNGRAAIIHRRFASGRTFLLVGIVLLLLLGSGGFIYASVVNQKSANPGATATTQISATNFAVATADAATATGVSANAQASATAFALSATATARSASATAQANATATALSRNATATVQANPTPIPTPTTVPPTPVGSSLKILGPMNNLNGYCQSTGYSGAKLTGNTAYSWYCVTSSGQLAGISMTSACRWQYGDSQAEDRMVDYFDPNSWQCFTGAKELGVASNLAGYCQSIGDSSVSLDGNNAYSWHCVTPSGQDTSIDMDAVCQWQYDVSVEITRLANYNDPYSWQCWG